MLTGHFGNWEMAGYLFGVFGFPPNSVARTLDNPLPRLATSATFRERTGQKMIPKKGGYDQMLAVLQGRAGVLSFLADQDAGERGMFVDFFGRPGLNPQGDRDPGRWSTRPPLSSATPDGSVPGFRYEVGCTELLRSLTSSPATLPPTPRLLTQRYTTAARSHHPPRPRPVPLAPPPLERNIPAPAQKGPPGRDGLIPFFTQPTGHRAKTR